MRKTRATRQVLAMMVVTTALCADRVATAAPAVRAPAAAREAVPPVVQLAGRLVSRLSRGFCQAVPAARPAQVRQPQAARPVAAVRPVDARLVLSPPPLSPFQFRLPPPTA